MADPLGFVNLIEVEDMARKVLDKQAYDYYSGGKRAQARRDAQRRAANSEASCSPVPRCAPAA